MANAQPNATENVLHRSVGPHGRIDYDIEVLRGFLDSGLSVKKIATMYKVQPGTIFRWMKRHGLQKRPRSQITDEDLDAVVREIFAKKEDAGT